MKFSGIIFDLDGTIADTSGDLSNSMNLMLESYNFKRKSRDEILQHINLGARLFVSGCLPGEIKQSLDYQDFLDEALNRYKAFYAEHYWETTQLYNGISELVRTLHENGVKMCVLSNKQDDMTKKIVASLLSPDYFIEVLGFVSEEHFPHKPNPNSALYLADKMGCMPSETLYIGDSDIDMRTAINAGMFALGVTWGYRPDSVLIEAGADKIVHNSIEILDFVLKI